MLLARMLKNVLGDEKAATTIEYGLIISLIVLAIVGTLNTLATNTIEMWSYVSQSVLQNTN